MQLQIKKILSSLLPFVLFFSNIASNVAVAVTNPCDVTKTIQANSWAQFGIPCKAPQGQNTLAAIIGDDMSGTHDSDWRVFSYDPMTKTYQKVKLEDSLEVGKGYWINNVNQSYTLDMPINSSPVNTVNSNQCLTSGCFESTLVTTGDTQYHMLANPFYHSVKGTDLRVNTDDESGLTLLETDTDILANTIWHYNGGEYEQLQNKTMSPWTGAWFATLATAPLTPQPRLLFPTNAETYVLHGSSYPDPIVDTSTIGEYTLNNGEKVNVVPIGYNIPNHVLGADIASIQAISGAPDIVVAPTGTSGAAGTLADPIHINELNDKINGRSNLHIVFRGGQHVFTSNATNWEIRIDGNNNTFDAYQNEKVILSGIDRKPTATSSAGWGSGGLLIKGNGNLWQRMSITKMPFVGLRVDGNHNTFQAMQVYKCYGSGVAFYDTITPNTHQGLGGSNNTFRHSYIYLNSAEGVIEHPNYPGRYSNGAHTDGISSSLGTVDNILENLTIWKNSDDGLDFWIAKGSQVKNSISAFNGLGDGDGNGFKFGGYRSQHDIRGKDIKLMNCLSFQEKKMAFSNNEGLNSELRNVTAISSGSVKPNIWLSPSSQVIDSISADGYDNIEGTSVNLAQGVALDKFISLNPLSPDFAKPKAGSNIKSQGAYKGL
ncbi:MAG: hypothetical protein KAH20_10310 [Methylococcales bacterium]|nr:hypothetical protein [Methylococcales bacterium]